MMDKHTIAHLKTVMSTDQLIDFLADQLAAAEKERDEFRLVFQQNEQVKQELFAHKDLLITANLNISRRAQTAEAQVIELKVAALVPGTLHCAKCKFQLTKTNLYMKSGTTGPGDSKTEPCPNGCGPLWPVTWRQWAFDASAAADKYFDELKAAEARLLVPVTFDELADAVKYVTGGIRIEFDPKFDKGHQAVPFMNFNSLSRIVEMFRAAGYPVEGGE